MNSGCTHLLNLLFQPLYYSAQAKLSLTASCRRSKIKIIVSKINNQEIVILIKRPPMKKQVSIKLIANKSYP
jgi:hypothetical protein